jgi:calcium-dependent protein kinase
MTSATPVYVTRLAALLCTLQVNASIPEDDVQALFAASDPEGLGKLDYEEFIAAMLDSSKVAKRQHVVRKSF